MLTTEDQLSSNRTAVVQGDHQGRIWVGHQTGEIDLLAAEDTRRFGPESGLPAVGVTAIIQDAKDRMWVGTRGEGAAVLRDGRFHRFTTADGLVDDNDHGIYEAGDGTLWFATASGLTRYEAEDETAFTIGRAQGLPAGEVYDLVQDHTGDFWLSTDSGIVHLKRQDVARLLAGDIEAVDASRYDQGHGMLTSECQGGSQRNLLSGQDGTIYAATTRGVVVVEPLRAFDERPPSEVIPSRLWVNGEPMALPDPESTARLGKGRTDVAIEFLGTSYLVPRNTRFRYRLHGQDDDWIEAGASRTARYPQLPPGLYRFEVQASTDEHWDTPTATLPFQIGRLPWQWIWTYVLLALGAIVLGYRLHHRRFSQQLLREAALEEALHTKAKELRDTTLVDPSPACVTAAS